ncbi:rho GTPase [Thecamonas trahens ATCC 50062]|uniref:Rho GTPase n=1 Tax=Thecamonas trahens ATCC 50062 TaxID=461836 RepID=A0A0L0DS17_THETB|nr:rho GTPase [Thecamonas trahens ATCC 50062]KNC54233.1 rho GTPase [Thecamonas trahens ATCC 50062]|eukprot:XP_013753871.1 rho GTPase [Thecamonas trahens ATCC 50062]
MFYDIAAVDLLLWAFPGRVGSEVVPTVMENVQMPVTVDGKSMTLTLRDTAGGDDFARIRPLSYQRASVALVCFSVASRSSYDRVSSVWAPELDAHCPSVPRLVVGLATDVGDDRVVTAAEGRALSEAIGAAEYVEASAKTGGVEAASAVLDAALA